jgi:hypothetical protein
MLPHGYRIPVPEPGYDIHTRTTTHPAPLVVYSANRCLQGLQTDVLMMYPAPE